MHRTLLAVAAVPLVCIALLLLVAAEGEPQGWSIGTFNIRYANAGDGANAWERRKDMVVAMLREGDVWGLQEVLPEQVAAIRKDLPEWSMVVRSREKDPAQGEACPILFRTDRWELDAEDHGTFWLSETPEAPGSKSWDSSLPRIATFARLTERGGGRSMYVFNVHLDHQGPQARLEAAKLVAKRMASRRHPDPAVLLGDFNTGPSTPPIRALLDDAALGLVDAWRAAHPSDAERGTFNGWNERCGAERIDFLLPSRGLEVLRCDIDDRKPEGRWPSDHAAVHATIRPAAAR